MKPYCINKEILAKMNYYVALNACTVGLSGLYNGKAGMSLALFEASRVLADEYLEEQASQLLQEALLVRTQDIGFENGLSGIGYAVLYLLENGFIEAEFEDVFGKQALTICQQAGKQQGQCEEIGKRSLYSVIYFLHHYSKWTNKLEIRELEDKLFRRMLEELLQQASRTNASAEEKTHWLILFKQYLSLSLYCHKLSLQPDEWMSLYAYAHACESQEHMYHIGYDIRKVAEQAFIDDLQAQARSHLEISVSKFEWQKSTLATQVDFLFRPLHEQPYWLKAEEMQMCFSNADAEYWEDYLTTHIPASTFYAGYQYGVSRLILWAVNDATGRKRNDVLRPL